MNWLPHPGEPFADDQLLRQEVERLITQYGIQSAVETGTFQGATTKVLTELVSEVHSIEIEPAFFEAASSRLHNIRNVQLHYGSSLNVLPHLLPHVRHPTLYYLDAHWDGNYPLLEEIKIIASHDPQPIIVMHDMHNPNLPELYAEPQPNGSSYCYEWVRPELEKIQMPCRHYYNEAAEGLQIGVMFVVPVVS
jgi:hypothetical protein